MSNDTQHSICSPLGASIGERLRNIFMLVAFLLSVCAHLRTVGVLCIAFLLSACATQSTKTVTVDVPVATRVTVNVPSRPHLPIAEISTRDSAGRRMERYSETIELLMGYAMQLECLLKPYAAQPDLVPCNESVKQESANAATPPKASAKSSAKPAASIAPKRNTRIAPLANGLTRQVKAMQPASRHINGHINRTINRPINKSKQSTQSAEQEGSPDSLDSPDYIIPPP